MEPEQPIPLAGRKAKGKPLVLVVDDDRSHRKLLELLAERLEITAHLTSSCEEALSVLEMFSFDVVLMDVRMPGIDGFMCTQKIRALSPEAEKTPIVAVTAQVAPNDRQKCLSAGMDDYLAKPFTLEQLHDKLIFWLQKKQE